MHHAPKPSHHHSLLQKDALSVVGELLYLQVRLHHHDGAQAEELVPDERVERVGREERVQEGPGHVAQALSDHPRLHQVKGHPHAVEERELDEVGQSHHEVHDEVLNRAHQVYYWRVFKHQVFY